MGSFPIVDVGVGALTDPNFNVVMWAGISKMFTHSEILCTTRFTSYHKLSLFLIFALKVSTI